MTQFFILFILYTFLTACVSMALILIRVIRCQYYVPPGAAGSSPSAMDEYHCSHNHYWVIFALGVITVLFFFFTFCMLLEQTEAISTNMSKIARMKTRAGMVSHPNEYAPVATEFNEVFGGEHPSLSWHWLLPLPVKFPEWAMDNIMGYEWDVTFDAAPYQEPADTDGESTTGGSVRSGVTSLGGDAGDCDVRESLGGMDVETGSGNLEQGLLNENEKEGCASSRDSGVKKRSTGSLP